MYWFARGLKRAGVRVWVDEANLTPTTVAFIDDSIESAIARAKCLLVLLSPYAKNSRWVKAEITKAINQEKPVIPVLIHGSIEESVPFILTVNRVVDARDQMPQALDLIRKVLYRKFEIGEIKDIHTTVIYRGSSLVQVTTTQINQQQSVIPKLVKPGAYERQRQRLFVLMFVVIALIIILLLTAIGNDDTLPTATPLPTALPFIPPNVPPVAVPTNDASINLAPSAITGNVNLGTIQEGLVYILIANALYHQDVNMRSPLGGIRVLTDLIVVVSRNNSEFIVDDGEQHWVHVSRQNTNQPLGWVRLSDLREFQTFDS